jgi:hypothetical protein
VCTALRMDGRRAGRPGACGRRRAALSRLRIVSRQTAQTGSSSAGHLHAHEGALDGARQTAAFGTAIIRRRAVRTRQPQSHNVRVKQRFLAFSAPGADVEPAVQARRRWCRTCALALTDDKRVLLCGCTRVELAAQLLGGAQRAAEGDPSIVNAPHACADQRPSRYLPATECFTWWLGRMVLISFTIA